MLLARDLSTGGVGTKLRSIDGDVRSIGGIDRIWQSQTDSFVERIDVTGLGNLRCTNITRE